MRLTELLKLAQQNQAQSDYKAGLDAYERTRQAINLSSGGSSPPGSKDWKREQSRAVIENQGLPGAMRADQRSRDAFSAAIRAGKAWDDKDGTYGIFDKDGYTAYLDKDQPDEITVSPEEFKANAERVAEILSMVTGNPPNAFKPEALGNWMVRYKGANGLDADFDPMRMKHLIMRTSDPSMLVPVQALPEKKAP